MLLLENYILTNLLRYRGHDHYLSLANLAMALKFSYLKRDLPCLVGLGAES